MKTYLVATVTCPDRPGIVERLTEVIVEHSANWEESRMARLGGDFAGIVKIGVAPERAEALAESLRALTNEQMTVTLKATQAGGLAAHTGANLCEFRLTGADHEGIVHTVTAYLAKRGINVESMETEVVPAPISASPLFQMHAQVLVPQDLAVSDLAENLRRIGEEQGVDIEVRPLEG